MRVRVRKRKGRGKGEGKGQSEGEASNLELAVHNAIHNVYYTGIGAKEGIERER